jgi:3-hydroxybutyryl-CoA dehydrogenase
MKVVVLANVDQQEEILSKFRKSTVELVFIKDISEISKHQSADVFLILSDASTDLIPNSFYGKPVFINSVIATLIEKKLPVNFSRINGWPGFLNREIWEVATLNKELTKKVFNEMGWKMIFVKDEPGLVTARVISMIINEAFFALEDEVSTVNEIDLAMKLGTNYPYGPFEWMKKIGVINIYNLLQKLATEKKIYSPAPLLKKTFLELTSNSTT